VCNADRNKKRKRICIVKALELGNRLRERKGDVGGCVWAMRYTPMMTEEIRSRSRRGARAKDKERRK
jgi:hypothetical protein